MGLISGLLAVLVTMAISAPALSQSPPGTSFRDCEACPEMVVIPSGSFIMGSPEAEPDRWPDEGPQREVMVGPFAIGRFEVTRAEFGAFVSATGHPISNGCRYWIGLDKRSDPSANWLFPRFAQADSEPVTCVSWIDAQAYAQWLSDITAHEYRLPSEAEWEYAARAGTNTTWFWGSNVAAGCDYANASDYSAAADVELSGRLINVWPCHDGHVHTSAVGSYLPNGFGVFDMLGNVWEWTQDCWNPTYHGAPTASNVWESGDCRRRVTRGGSWIDGPEFVRSANRGKVLINLRYNDFGFRVARSVFVGS